MIGHLGYENEAIGEKYPAKIPCNNKHGQRMKEERSRMKPLTYMQTAASTHLHVVGRLNKLARPHWHLTEGLTELWWQPTPPSPWRGAEKMSSASPLLPIPQLVRACGITKSRTNSHSRVQTSTQPRHTPAHRTKNFSSCRPRNFSTPRPSPEYVVPPHEKLPAMPPNHLLRRRGGAKL